MSRLPLSHKSTVVRHSNTVGAGTTVITPSGFIDMQNMESCLFIAEFGAITATGVQSIEVHQSDASGGSYAALLGTKVSLADDDDTKVVMVEVVKPRKRFLKCIVNRATANAVLEGITAVLTGPKKLPTTQGTTVVASEVHTSPAEGTA